MSDDKKGYMLAHSHISLPLHVTGARRGIGSFLIINLASKSESPSMEISSQYSLWIYLCDWAIWKHDKEILNSDCEDDSEYSRILNMLVGRDLETAVASSDNETCEFTFSEDMHLFVDDADDIYGSGKDLLMVFLGRKCIAAFKSGIGLYTPS